MATTEQLMAQYGVAWFDFDESSGNVHDKLGLNNYVGTVTGATRVGGWNGEGNAVELSGSPQFISFNNPVIPIGEKTIRFKFFPSSVMKGNATRRLIDCSISNTSGGFSLVLGNDSIRPIIRKNNTTYFTDSVNKVNYDQWNDIFISYTGRNENAHLKIGINDEFYNYYMGIDDSPAYGNLFIGKMNPSLSATTSTGEFLVGKIDDLQIYNKALSPSDFTQKRLAVKAVDNKNLVLSPTSARVKEIPNTLEYMMLAQGGVVKEIDSAVDRPPIDFTKPTTEYELVTNNKTPLGKGRMFTIPIGSDFKTAMIEDNY